MIHNTQGRKNKRWIERPQGPRGPQALIALLFGLILLTSAFAASQALAGRLTDMPRPMQGGGGKSSLPNGAGQAAAIVPGKADRNNNNKGSRSRPADPVVDASVYLTTNTSIPGNCPAPTMGGTTQVGCRFVLDMFLNAGSNAAPDGVTAQQSYMTFTWQTIQNARTAGIATSCVPTNSVTADLMVFDASLQNEVCDGPAPCNFRGTITDPGSFSFASGALSNCPMGCPDPSQPPPQDQPIFRIASIGICAVSPGVGGLYWQFANNPPNDRCANGAPLTRDTEIISFSGGLVEDCTRFMSYTFTITGPTNTPGPSTDTPTTTPTLSPSPTRIQTIVPPTLTQTNTPTLSPTAVPPTVTRTITPTSSPTSVVLTNTPTLSPTIAPPTLTRTITPTSSPTSVVLTNTPTLSPTIAPPTLTRTITPTSSPTLVALTNTPTFTSVPTFTPVPPTATRTFTPVPTSTMTSTPGGPTNTPTNTSVAPTATNTPGPATSTPTQRPMPFTDVHANEYFYAAVGYLWNQGVISGYSDNTFRPYDTTTRAQMCKIIVVALKWPLNTAGGPHFSDVPKSDIFYGYIETAYNQGVITGYGDGTFHPNGSVTRGQLCQIVVKAMGWATNVIGGPHFKDVLSTDAFYGAVETAFNHGVISGYACDGEPCDAKNRPYYHPFDNAARGQISKVVYLAVTHP